MSSDKAQVEQLTEELKLVQKAIPPQRAAQSLRDWMDSHAHEDMLAGTAEGANPWLAPAPSGGGCCTVT
jgi:hypothetical protein